MKYFQSTFTHKEHNSMKYERDRSSALDNEATIARIKYPNTPYSSAIQKLQDTDKAMHDRINAIHEDGTITDDQKVLDITDTLTQYDADTKRMVKDIDSSISHGMQLDWDALFTTSPKMSDVEKAFIPVLADSLMTNHIKHMENRSKSNIINSMLSLGYFEDSKGVGDMLNERYSPEAKESLANWFSRNDTLTKINSYLTTTKNFKAFDPDKVNRIRLKKVQ